MLLCWTTHLLRISVVIDNRNYCLWRRYQRVKTIRFWQMDLKKKHTHNSHTTRSETMRKKIVSLSFSKCLKYSPVIQMLLWHTSLFQFMIHEGLFYFYYMIYYHLSIVILYCTFMSHVNVQLINVQFWRLSIRSFLFVQVIF